jgi:hypothetical protein
MKICPLSILSLLVAWSTTTMCISADRDVVSLNGVWQFQTEQETSSWKDVTLPARFEDHEGTDFDGVGTYRRILPSLELPAGKRAILHFQAAATLAEVSINDSFVGSHLGGWTPFRFDVTQLLRSADPGVARELKVRLDEKVGHNSQGFLPIVAPHFGGIWQDVQLLVVSETWMDDLSILAIGDYATSSIRIEVRINHPPAADGMQMAVRYRPFRQDDNWSTTHVLPVVESPTGKSLTDVSQAKLNIRSGRVALRVPVADAQRWSTDTPNLYEVEIELRGEIDGDMVALDRVTTRAAFRDFRVDGSRLILNDRPVSIRGVLNWGYAPPRLGPSTDERHMRQELEFARSYGFNLMKFCLWVPPKRYLELADEMGMLAWVEYPTWHSKWTADQLPKLEREFSEFFCFDRNHPCVVLRSLTCETGPSADLKVIKALYDRCHAMIPGSIVEDDSSWIGWNRIHDFYDDHPYGNNHTWVATLDRLKQHISEREEKPLVLGEAIAADTWVDRRALLDQVGSKRPFWLPGFLEGNQVWIEQMERIVGSVDEVALTNDSKRFAELMRKYQIETYRREVPFGGYVVSVIRDFPLASMGLIDFLGRPKWAAKAWRWHGETMIALETAADRRSWSSRELLEADFIISHFGRQSIHNATLQTVVQTGHGEVLASKTSGPLTFAVGDVKKALRLAIELPEVSQPTRIIVRVTLQCGTQSFENAWPMWIVPAVPHNFLKRLFVHGSCSKQLREQFSDARPFADADPESVVVASRFDQALIKFIESGGRVFLVPDGQTASLPLSNVWYLRGGPLVASHPATAKLPREFLVELLHFDMAGPVVPDLGYLEQITPILMFWDNHDLQRVKTHGVVFETRIGKGRLLVSTLNHLSPTNAAGRWLLARLLQHLEQGAPPRHAMQPATIQRMREKVDEAKIELVRRPWQFKPDPENQGLSQGWQKPDFVMDQSWKEIQIGTAWEGLGFPALDGWAWYRISVEIPHKWSGKQVYVSFEGVDDYYELYVNGHRAGSGGDIESKTTAFEDRTSHLATDFVQPGQTATIAVRVYDWQGAGGLFRPVSIGTAAFGSGQTEVLK